MPGTKEKKNSILIMRVDPIWKERREKCRDAIMPNASLAEYIRRMVDLGEIYYHQGR